MITLMNPIVEDLYLKDWHCMTRQNHENYRDVG